MAKSTKPAAKKTALSKELSDKIKALFDATPGLKAVFLCGNEYYGQEKTAKKYFGEGKYKKISRDGFNV